MLETVANYDQQALNPVSAIHQTHPCAESIQSYSNKNGTIPAAVAFKKCVVGLIPKTTQESTEQARLVELLSAIRAGDQQAFKLFYDLTATRVLGAAQRILQNHEDAEEIVGTTFLQVWQSAKRYDPEKATVLGWLTMIARSRALDCRRRRQRRSDVEVYSEQDEKHESVVLMDGVEDDYCVYEQSEAVRVLLNELPIVQRQIMDLAYFHECSHREIAELTGLPIGTVKSHLRRTLIQLRKSLVS